MKKAIITILVATLLATISFSVFASCKKDSANLSGYVAIDINPSVEFITDADGRVTGMRAANKDAEVLLSDLDLVGKDIETAVETVTKSAEETGYLNDQNTDVTVTVGANDERGGKKLRQKAEDGVRKGSRKAVLANDENNQALIDELNALKAENPELYKNLTVAKLKLAKSIAEYDRNFTPAMAAQMKTSTLVHMLHEYFDDYEDLVDDEIEAEYEALVATLTADALARRDAIFGEEYAAKAKMMRELEALEDKFELELERQEAQQPAPVRYGDGNQNRFDIDDCDCKYDCDCDDDDDDFDDDDDDDFDEILTQAMIDELTAVIGEHRITDLDGLDDYIDDLEDELERIERNTVLTDEQKAELNAIRDEIIAAKRQAKEQLSDKIQAKREELRAKKHELKNLHR